MYGAALGVWQIMSQLSLWSTPPPPPPSSLSNDPPYLPSSSHFPPPPSPSLAQGGKEESKGDKGERGRREEGKSERKSKSEALMWKECASVVLVFGTNQTAFSTGNDLDILTQSSTT